MKTTVIFVVSLLLIIQGSFANEWPTKKSTGPSAHNAKSPTVLNGATVAGGYGKGSDSNQFNNPQGIFVDENANIYIADTYNSRIQKWAPGAMAGVTVAGGNGQGAAANQLYNPSKIFVDATGNIYIADQYNNRIQKWAPGAKTGVTVAGGHGRGSAANQLATPYDVFVDKIGDIFISDMNNNRIQRWKPGADTGVTVLGGNGRGTNLHKLNKPKGLFVNDSYSNSRTFYIVDADNARVLRWSLGNTEASVEAGGNGRGSDDNQLFDPEGVYVDPTGKIYVTDPANNRVQKWEFYKKNGITVAGGNGIGGSPEKLSSPRCVFVDKSDNIYVSDGNNNRIQKFSPADNGPYLPEAITLAGGNTSDYVYNGPDQLRGPTDVALDSKGNMFIADYGNRRIQKWLPGAAKGTTFAGGSYPGMPYDPYNELRSPQAVITDTADNVYIIDGNQIWKYPPNGSSHIKIAGERYGGQGPAQFNFPRDIALDNFGNIFILDHWNDRIQKWKLGASSGVTVVDGKQNGRLDITAFCVDAGGSIYLADNKYRILKWQPGATSGITVAGGNGYGSATNQLSRVSGMCVDGSGDLYISDQYNHRILKWVQGAKQGTIVGGGIGSYGQRSTAANKLTYPEKIFLDKEKNIYVADSYNNRIQKFTPRESTICPDDIYLKTASCDTKVTVKWLEPDTRFPSTLYIPPALDPRSGKLILLGNFAGHGYYKSEKLYSWVQSAKIAGTIGDTSVPGHLVTINNTAENDFVFSKIKDGPNAPWIGLFTGFPGSFRWINNEPATYTNWIAGEPNNAGGGILNMKEPYVRMSNLDGKWNDQKDDNFQFIMEFDKPVANYKQISGPKNGSNQKAGVYQVCYEKTNVITDKKDTCCFNIVISCDGEVVNQQIESSNTLAEIGNELAKKFQSTVTPNPSTSYFKVQVSGNDHRNAVKVSISDITGRQVEVLEQSNPVEVIKVGKNLRAGVYFIRVTQGMEVRTQKVIKK